MPGRRLGSPAPRPPPTEAPAWDVGDEVGLVAAALRDRRAFAVLYRRYVEAVYRYCYHRLGGREAAEDATSQVFVKALAALASHRPDRSFRSWLFAIAHNVVTDSYRARRPVQPLAAAVDVVDAAPTPEEVAIAADERRSVGALLARLPPDQGRVLELRLAGLTGPEVAQVLGRSLGSVKIAQVRAYARLRTMLGAATREETCHAER